ncbi:MAG: NAD(P)-dependent oxidoreductase [Pirellulaceae bacterium]
MNRHKRVSIIGVGLLGQAITDRLLEHDYVIAGFDIDDQRCQELIDKQVPVSSSAADCASNSDVLILSLPDSDIVNTVISDIKESLAAGTVVIDTTTGPAKSARDHAMTLESNACSFLDATVAGSSVQVRNGEGVIMIGGHADTYQSLSNLFDAIAPKSFYVGETGAGCDMKLIVNLALGLNRAVLAESLALAESAGVDSKLALEVMKSTVAYSAAMDTKGPKMVAGNFEPQARLRQHLKDVLLILEMGREHGQQLPLSQLHEELLSSAVENGLGELDNSAIIELIRKLT